MLSFVFQCSHFLSPFDRVHDQQDDRIERDGVAESPAGIAESPRAELAACSGQFPDARGLSIESFCRRIRFPCLRK